MNILPKKRWHVRTKENITRVRRDEAKAAAEEAARKQRAQLAESEARRTLLLEKSRKRFKSDTNQDDLKTDSKNSHYTTDSLIEELKNSEVNKTNKEHDNELKEEKEKYEKQIGYLTYLGQDTNEALGKRSWYEVAPERGSTSKEEINMKSKVREDPMTIMTKLGVYKKKDDKHSKKSKHHSTKNYDSLLGGSKHNDVNDDEAVKQKRLALMRQERLKREAAEKQRTEKLLKRLRGDTEEDNEEKGREMVVKRKYNSQFFPELAKQNYK